MQAELGHAQRFARRIKELYGTPPGSEEFQAEQSFLQPDDPADVVSAIKGVLEAESAAIEHYNRLIEVTDGSDWVTMDLVIDILDDEESLRQFKQFLRE